MKTRRMTARTKQRLFSILLMTVLTLILVTAVLTPTVLAKTYVIRDGERTITYTTFASDPEQVLDEAGMDLGVRDSFTTEPLADGETIHIRRSQGITVRYHGKTMMATVCDETAGELLQRLGLEVTGEDMVSCDLQERTRDGMVLTVDRVQKKTETYTTMLAHETQRCFDASVPQGMEEILTQGVDGELLCTAVVTYVNGIETQREVLSQTVTRAPVTEIIGIGTGTPAEEPDPDAMPEIGDGVIRLPTGEVLTYSGTATIRATAYTHTDAGCDFITATGTTVHKGTVAVDPRYIPYGTRMFIVSNDGAYVCGVCVAEDCGGDIKGDRMDVYFPTYEECRQFGRRVCTIYYLS